MSKKITLVKEHTFLRPKFVRFLHQAAKSLGHHERLAGRRQWIIADAANKEWLSLPLDIKEEITKEIYAMEVSQRLNEVLSFPIVSASGETLDYWMKIAATYEGFPNLEIWKDALSFDHFRRAKKIALDPSNNITSPMEALARAYDQGWTAREMEIALTKMPDTDPKILDLRHKYPEWLWRAAYPMLSMNGNRREAEQYLKAYQKLVEKENIHEF